MLAQLRNACGKQWEPIEKCWTNGKGCRYINFLLYEQFLLGGFGDCNHGRMLQFAFNGNGIKPFAHIRDLPDDLNPILSPHLFCNHRRCREQSEATLPKHVKERTIFKLSDQEW